jgi:multidrug resistance efflux pump
MKRFYIATILIVGILIGLTAYYRSEPDTFYGIADTKEIVINSESPVEVRRIWVAQGQKVQAGDTLLELFNPELELKINEISHELSVMKTRESTHASLTRSEIKQLQAQQMEKASEIRAEISELEAQYNLNRQLTNELRSLKTDRDDSDKTLDDSNPIKLKIKNLKRLLELAQDPSRVYENRLTDALSNSGDPMIEQAKLLQEELEMLKKEKKGLLIEAQIAGLIGSVNFKAGEKVSPFASILTLHAASPSFIRGYIHEDVMSEVSVSQKVMVHTDHGYREVVEGAIIGVGTRIVEYPERLRKRADIQIWGREIIVKLPDTNRFLLGEKVRITLMEQPRAEVMKDIQPKKTAHAGLAPTPKELPGIEASGALYVDDLGKLLIVSDETESAPMLYLVDSLGLLERGLPIRGLDKMDDMESIAQNASGDLFVLSSLSLNKKGKTPPKRSILAQLKRDGETLSLAQQVNLRELLTQSAKAEPTQPWAVFLQSAISSGELDIEGMAVHGQGLLLGFKAPLLDGKAVILKLENVASIWNKSKLGSDQIQIWKQLDLKDAESKQPCGISELQWVGDSLFIVSTGSRTGGKETDSKHLGGLWVYRPATDQLVFKRDFKGQKVEGLAYHASSQSLFVTVDNGGEKPSQLLRLEVQP